METSTSEKSFHFQNNFIGSSDHIFIPDEDNDCYLEVLNLILIFKFYLSHILFSLMIIIIVF